MPIHLKSPLFRVSFMYIRVSFGGSNAPAVSNHGVSNCVQWDYILCNFGTEAQTTGLLSENAFCFQMVTLYKDPQGKNIMESRSMKRRETGVSLSLNTADQGERSHSTSKRTNSINKRTDSINKQNDSINTRTDSINKRSSAPPVILTSFSPPKASLEEMPPHKPSEDSSNLNGQLNA